MKRLIFALMVIALLVPMVAYAGTKPLSYKVDICHWDEGGKWTSNNVNDSSVDGDGNNDHQQHAEDIIPPFYDDGRAGYWASKNWDAEGQEIWNNDCKKPTPEDQKVTASVTFHDPTCEDPTAYWTGSNTDKITYKLKKGDVVAPGEKVEIEAKANKGYKLEGEDKFTHTFGLVPTDCGGCTDTDQDGVCDNVDNCPLIANPGQEDANGNGIGDACDEVGCTDTDQDGICDEDETCATEPEGCPPPPPVDVCTNLPGDQATMPEGYEDLDQDGVCTLIPPPPTDLCSNLEGNQGTMPDGYEDPNQDGICTEIVIDPCVTDPASCLPPTPEKKETCEHKMYEMATFEFPSGKIGYLVSWDGYPANVSRQLCHFGEIAENTPVFEWVIYNSCTGSYSYNDEPWYFYDPTLEEAHWHDGACLGSGC